MTSARISRFDSIRAYVIVGSRYASSPASLPNEVWYVPLQLQSNRHSLQDLNFLLRHLYQQKLSPPLLASSPQPTSVSCQYHKKSTRYMLTSGAEDTSLSSEAVATSSVGADSS